MTRTKALRTAAAGSVLALLAAAGATGVAEASTHARVAHSSKPVVQSLYPVPHSSVVYGIATKGSRYYLVSGKNGHFKTVWAPKLKNGYLDSVYAVSKNNVFIGGALGIPTPGCTGCGTGKIEIWHKVGKQVKAANFNQYNFGTGAVSVPQFAGSSPKDVWAIGQFNENNTGGPQAMHWNGKKWSLVQVPQDDLYSGLTSIASISPNDAWAVRGGGEGDSDMQHWDGKTWTDTGPVLNVTGSGAVSGESGKNVYEYGTNAKGKQAIDKYNGKKWVQMKVKGWPASSVVTDMATVGKQGWALVAYRNAKELGQAVILHTSGSSWKPVWKSHGGDWEFGSAFEVSSLTHGLFTGSRAKSQYSTFKRFAVSLHGHRWKLGG
ncbi:MAG TPA: hypothetical protein VHV79_10210 [Mycobacteriales bacterium]|nr:hypothetical protein [Mycobacteriales bacterium]